MKIRIVTLLFVLITLNYKLVLAQTHSAPAELNILLETKTTFDSVFISNITQDKIFHFLPFSNKLHITSDEPLNDLYNIIFYSGGKSKMNQFWLDGKNVTIKGKVNDKSRLEIDTVIGSGLYYKALAFKNEYKKLLTDSANAEEINSFLLSSFKKNIDNMFSVEIGSQYFMKNINNKQALRKIYELQVQQDSSIAKHGLNDLKKIEKILLDTKVDLSKFQFYNRKGELTLLDLPKGKKYLFDFWFVGCAPCVQDHKLISAKLKTLTDNQIELISISIDKNQETWKNYLTTKKYNWQNVREVDDFKKNARKDLLIEVFPTYILTDENGNVLNRSFSINEILKAL